eukprot:scaffold1192_cov83-Skeletonema_dohrnii-CCMP3373.AAC.4
MSKAATKLIRHAAAYFLGRPLCRWIRFSATTTQQFGTMISISLNKVIIKVSIFFSITAAVAAAATDEAVASTPSSTKRELKGDAEVSYGSYDGSISMSYATSAKAAKTKSAKANDASSKASKAKVSKSYSYSMSYGPGCERSKCVDPDVPRFIVDRSVDIGDTLLQKEPDMPKRCGCDCYTLKDSGKPPFDLELGDTQRFAYREVTSTNFSIKSRTCGVKCYVGDEIVQPPIQLDYGRVGLEVRQSLDPFSANVFISHVPQLRAEWSWREKYNETPSGGVHYSLDETCLWISLTRRGDKFTWTYAYDAYLPDEECESVILT